ncbi:hypothetical protein M0R04_02305 [Candidatus Dojkabacteria bacterium]|jgi:hypothetical protein|nr:hypothetical protein [Candidatus Dojkabacteria bacterium]
MDIIDQIRILPEEKGLDDVIIHEQDSGVDITVSTPGQISIDQEKFAMPLSGIRSIRDLEKWREHNVEVAAYLGNFVRTDIFDYGTKAREMFIQGNYDLPPEIFEWMNTVESIKINPKGGSDFVISDLEPSDELPIQVYDENHPRARMLKSLVNGEEIPSEVVLWLADYLGVPMMINYTAPEGLSSGMGGHAQALVRTPYQNETGEWIYDVIDPMRLSPVIGVRLSANSQEEAFQQLSKSMIASNIADHLIKHRVEFNLLEKISGTEAYDLLLKSGVSKIQEKDYINCQFYSLLIQSYLWAFYRSINDFSKGAMGEINLGNVIYNRFEEVFNVSIKELFEIMGKFDENLTPRK